MASDLTVWSTPDRQRWFILPANSSAVQGPLSIRSLTGQTEEVDPRWLIPFEVTETQARDWAKHELGVALDELNHGFDEKLADLRRQLDEKNRTPVTENTTVTPNSAPALFDLLKTLPGVIGNSLSGEESRVESAKTAMANLQRQLKEAGIDLDDRFTAFPGRLAGLREDLADRRVAKQPPEDEPPSDKP
jgi:hypothetical protein